MSSTRRGRRRVMAEQNGSQADVSAEDVEKEIVRSLAGDARAVANVCTDIVSWTGPLDVGRPSWSKPGSNVSLQIYINDPPNGSTIRYAPALEQTLDVVHVFLDLVIKYMNQMPNVSEAFAQTDMTVPSRRFTLSALVWMLWSRIKFVNRELSRQTVKTIDQQAYSRIANGTQTEETSVTACESCSTSQEMVSMLVTAVEDACNQCRIQDLEIVRTRKAMETEIYSITQLGAMKKWCRAILKDLSLLAGTTKEMKFQNVKMAHQLRDYRSESRLTVSKLEDLNKEKAGLIVTTEKAVESRASSLAKVNELKRKCQAKTEESSDWRRQFNELKAALDEMKMESVGLKESSVREKEKNLQLIQEIQKKSKKIDSMELEMSRMKKEHTSLTYSLKDDIASRDLTISNQSDRMKILEEKLAEAEKKTTDLKFELAKEKAHGAQIWKSLEELKAEKEAQDDKLERNYAEMDDMMRRLNEVEDNILSMPNFHAPATEDPAVAINDSQNEIDSKHPKMADGGAEDDLLAAADGGQQRR